MGTVRVALWALLCAALAQGALVTTPTSVGASAAVRPPLAPSAATTHSPSSAHFVVRKCCDLEELLDDDLWACVPLGNDTRQRINITSRQEQKLWWMDARVRLAPSRVVENLSIVARNASVVYNARPCQPDITSILWTTQASLYLNGSLEIQLMSAVAGPTKTHLVAPQDYCIDKTTRGENLPLAFLVCPCNHTVCIRKCCDDKRMLTISEAIAMNRDADCYAALPTNFKWNAPFPKLPAGTERSQGNVSYARLRGQFPNTCPAGRMNVIIEMSDTLSNALLPNGTLVAGVTGSPFSTRQFCVDYGKDNKKDGYFAYVCAKLPDPKAMTWRNYLYLVLYLVGLASLLATLAVYALLPELRRPVHAKVLMCHAAALAAALLTLAVSECISVGTYAGCASLAFCGQFFLLAAFFWLTVLCFDFTRGLMNQLPINDATSAGCRLLFYSLFAWSGPTIIVAVTIALNYAPRLPDWVQRPEIGLYNCWFSPTWAKFFYHYGPMACLLLANLIMFSSMIIRLNAAQRIGREMLKNDDSCRTGGALRKRREWMLLYAKLFALMGVTWLLEVVVWAVKADVVTMAIVDGVNVLRGLGVFVACCCKRSVLDALRDRLPCLGKRHIGHSPSPYTDSTDISRSTSISHGTELKRIAVNGDPDISTRQGKSVK